MIDWRLLGAAAALVPFAPVAHGCSQWQAGTQLVLRQADGWTMASLSQAGERLNGSAQMTAGQAVRSGIARGRVGGGRFWLRVQWSDGEATIYDGIVAADGSFGGNAFGEETPQARVPWMGQSPLACVGTVATANPLPAPPPPLAPAVAPAPAAAAAPAWSDPVPAPQSQPVAAPVAQAQPPAAASDQRGTGLAGMIRDARDLFDAIRGRPAAPPAPDPYAAPPATPQPDPGGGYEPALVPAPDTGYGSASVPTYDPVPTPAPSQQPGSVSRASPGAVIYRPVGPRAVSPAPTRPVVGLGRIPSRCAAGFVWREARATDYVCVTPDARARVARENSLHSQRVAPTFAAGSAPCLSGFVWREAFVGDRVCVQPASRTLAARENEMGPSRVAAP